MSIRPKFLHKYDEKGNEIEWKNYIRDATIINEYRFIYSDYDKFDNWRKRTTFRNNIPKKVTLKRI